MTETKFGLLLAMMPIGFWVQETAAETNPAKQPLAFSVCSLQLPASFSETEDAPTPGAVFRAPQFLLSPEDGIESPATVIEHWREGPGVHTQRLAAVGANAVTGRSQGRSSLQCTGS